MEKMICKKKILVIVFLFTIIRFSFGQCNCEKIYRGDGQTIVQCPPDIIAYDSKTQIGLSIASNGEDNFVTLTIRFIGNAKNVTSGLTLRLLDNNMITLSLVNQGKSYIDGSEVTQAIFQLSNYNKAKLSSSNINTINFNLSDGLNRSYKATSNSSILKNQIKCL